MNPACHSPTDVSDVPWEVLQLVLPQYNGMPMAYDPAQSRHGKHHGWRLAPLAACGPLDTGHGHAAPVGTAKPELAARTVGVLCREPEEHDGDASRGRGLCRPQEHQRVQTP